MNQCLTNAVGIYSRFLTNLQLIEDNSRVGLVERQQKLAASILNDPIFGSEMLEQLPAEQKKCMLMLMEKIHPSSHTSCN